VRTDLDALPDCPTGVLLIAAAAEAAGIGVRHYDEDYDRIAAIIGQPVRWLAPRGTLR